jgi:predicted RNase H-like nuclease (RuvC/YqgF family)
LLREVADTELRHDRRFGAIDRRFDTIDRRFEARERKVDDLESKVSGLRQAAIEYHASVLGHGILISELEQGLRHVEQRLNLPPAA